jgi:hypothetical protein
MENDGKDTQKRRDSRGKDRDRWRKINEIKRKYGEGDEMG